MLLHQILQNKTINFANKLRNRSFQKRTQSPHINIMQTIQRDKTQSHMDFMNSPTYSDASEIQLKYSFFP